MHSQVYKYFEDCKLFHSNHHGFLRNHSTATAIQQIFDFWMKGLDEGKFIGSLLLDLSAGFDVIDFDILLEKLKLYSFRENTLKWMVALSNPTLQPVKTIFEQMRLNPELQINQQETNVKEFCKTRSQANSLFKNTK